MGPLDRGFRSPESAGVSDLEVGAQPVGSHVPSTPLASHLIERGTPGSASVGLRAGVLTAGSKDISALRIDVR